MIRGPSRVSFTSMWRAPDRTPSAFAARTARATTRSASRAGRWCGMKFPVSRKGTAKGNFPVSARGTIIPLRATASTDT